MGKQLAAVVSLAFLVLLVSVHGKTDLTRREEVLTAKIIHLYKSNKTYATEFDKVFGSRPNLYKNVAASFPCPGLTPSPTVPTSVHSLRPADVKVVAALGDSLTAGRGAEGGIIGLLIDYRGLSWSIGGDKSYEDLRTLPNILRQYSNGLFGYSQGTGTDDPGFNVAVSGAKSSEMLEQAQRLVTLLKESSNVDFNNDWKVITVFIGGNDLCDWCDNREEYSAEKYTTHLQEALDYLHANVPRAFVNMVEVLNLEMVKDLADNLLCEAVHLGDIKCWLTPVSTNTSYATETWESFGKYCGAFACNCAANPGSQAELDELIRLREGYQKAARDLAASGRYDTNEDFTVVLQPFYRETFTPRTTDGQPDMSFFASDCFHHSKKGQQAAAEALWNNMVEPVGSKRLNWMPGEPIECPTEEKPYFFTAKNSNQRAKPPPSH